MMALLIYDPTGQLQFGTLIEPNGDQIPLCGRSLILGSSAADCDIVLEGDPTVRPRHCEIKRGGGRILLEATQSDAPTLVNGHPASPSELNDGDAVQIGQTQLKFAVSRPTASGLPTANPEPVAAEWYAEIAGRYQGPYSIQQLKEKIDSRVLGPTDYIRQGPSGTPQPAGRVAATKQLFQQAATAPNAAQAKQPDAWFVEVGSQTHGPLSTEEVADWIRSSRLNTNDFVRLGQRGPMQPAGRTAQLKKFFAPSEPTPSPPPAPVAQTPKLKSTSAQSPELQAMVNALPTAEDASPPVQPTQADQAAGAASNKKKRRKRSAKSAAEKQAADLDAVLDDVLFSEEPEAEKVLPTSAPTEMREAAAVAPAQSSAPPQEMQAVSPPTPAPSRPAPAAPKKAMPPKPKKSKAKSRSGGSGESLLSHPKAKPALIGIAIVALIYAVMMLWPSSVLTESHDEQLATLESLGNELQTAVKGTPEEWTAFRTKAKQKSQPIYDGYKGRTLDPVGEELKGAARMLLELGPETEREQARAALVKKLIERAKSVTGM